MNKLTLDFIISSCQGSKLGQGNPLISNIITDSRQNMDSNTLFIALKGENHDGHKFVTQAFNKGASVAIVSDIRDIDISNFEGKTLIVVEDTLVALQKIAKKYREQFDIPVIAVTGSVGKTTTKEILSLCLSSSFDTLYTEGNFNNDIGLPLTILRMEDHHEAAVVEVAMRGRSEISRLVDIARPTCAIITNVEPVHLETLGSIENIAKAKCEVLETLSNDEFAFINGDNDILLKTANSYPCRKYTFGYHPECDCRILNVNSNMNGIVIEASIFQEKMELLFPIPAPKLALNVVAVVGTALVLGLPIQDIISKLASYEPTGNRLKVSMLPEGGIVINDTYNANPVSMLAALETALRLKEDKRLIAVLGDMYELGEYEEEGHLRVGQMAVSNKVDVLITVGNKAANIAQGAIQAGMDKASVYHFVDKAECLSYLQHNLNRTDVVLFKASRGMQLETLISNWLGI